MIIFEDGLYEDYYLAYPILKKYNLKATSFVVRSRIKDIIEDYVENKTSFIGLDKIREIRKDYLNFEIQRHFYDLYIIQKMVNMQLKEKIEKNY